MELAELGLVSLISHPVQRRIHMFVPVCIINTLRNLFCSRNALKMMLLSAGTSSPNKAKWFLIYGNFFLNPNVYG